MSEPSWSDLERKPAGPPKDTRLSEICARVFTTPDGRELLAELRRLHFDSFASPAADERALRVRATQQNFVWELEQARDRGLAAAAKGG